MAGTLEQTSADFYTALNAVLAGDPGPTATQRGTCHVCAKRTRTFDSGH
jgi:hypothetical protein